MTGVSASRRSLLHGWHQGRGAEWCSAPASGLVARYATGEPSSAAELAMCDLTTLPRIGLSGPDAIDWLRGQGRTIPERPNQALRQADGELVLRLSDRELLVQANPFEVPASEYHWRDSPGVYTLPRADSHACFAFTGQRAVDFFSRVCAIDLRPHAFAEGRVVQTSVARVSAIITSVHGPNGPALLLWSPIAASEYLWQALFDIAEDLGGSAVGVEALQPDP